MSVFGWTEAGRGDVWTPANYLVSIGLCRYGYHDVAEELTGRTIRMICEAGINERYHPITGEKMGFPDVSMIGCVLNMMYRDFYGLQDDYRTIRISDEYWGRRLYLGAIEIEYTLNQQVKLRTGFSRQFNIILSESWQNREIAVNLVDGNKKSPVSFQQKGEVITFLAHHPTTKEEKSYYEIALKSRKEEKLAGKV